MALETGFVGIKDLDAARRPSHPKFIVPQHKIVQYFSEVRSKGDVVDGFLRFGGHCFSNLAIFSVFSKSVQFLRGTGDNMKNPPPLGGFNVDKNTVMRRVVVSKFPYRGPIPIGTDEKAIFSRFFNRFSEEIFIYPGSIRAEDTDILFYSDGFSVDRSSAILTFEYIVEKTVLALRLLWVQKMLTTI